MKRPLVTGLLLAALATPAFAIEPEEQLKDPKQEARARVIDQQLRCVVCQSENIDDSGAPVAKALRTLVRERIVAGDDDAQTMAAVTARYGDFVLFKPRFSAVNAVLWLGPFAVLILGGAGAVAFMRRQAKDGPEAPAEPLSAAEEAELATAMAETEPAGGERPA